MRIGILSSSLSNNAGGIYDVLLAHSKEIYRHNQDVFVIGNHDAMYNTSDWLPIKPLFYNVPFNNTFGYSSKIQKLINQSRLDILHLHGIWMYNHYISYNIQRKKHIPVIISPHGMLDPWAYNNSYLKKKLIEKMFANKSFNNAHCFHALCEAEAHSIQNHGIRKPIAIIPNGIYLPDESIKYTQPWKDNDAKFNLLFLGRIHPKKGLINLIDSIKIIKQIAPDLMKVWNIKIAGWDQLNHQKVLEHLVNKYGLNQNIEFLGPLFGPQKVAAYQNADAFILPSYSEGLPISILEAWSYKLPVLKTEFCNLPNGFLAKAAMKIENSPVEMAHEIMSFMSLNDEKRKLIGLNGFKLVKENYNWSIIGDQLIQLYQWVINQGITPSFVRLPFNN